MHSFIPLGHLHNTIILLQLHILWPESFRVFLSCANYGFCFWDLTGITHLNTKGKMILIVLILKESTYLKFPPNPRLCWRVCANISYLRMSLSLTDLRANFMASSKWSRLISGTGSSSSTSYIVTVPFVSVIDEHMSNTGNNNKKWQVFT